MPSPIELIADNLAYLVDEERRTSRKKLADAMGLSTQALGQIINRVSKDVGGSALLRAAQHLGITVEDLGSTRLRSRSAVAEIARSVSSSPGHLIPVLDVSASMGAGMAAPEHVDVVSNISVDLSQLRRMVNFTAPSNLRFITAYGDSMEGTFTDGDTLLVDTGVADIRIDAVYVLDYRNELFIKRIQRRPEGSVLMISDNKKYEPYLIESSRLEQFRVCGRVLLAWNVKRL